MTLTALFDTVMPLHMVLRPDGGIRHMGPSFKKLTGGAPARVLADVLTLRSVAGGAVPPLGEPLYCTLKADPKIQLKGVAAVIPQTQDYVLSLSLGASLVEAVRQFDLGPSDFAHNDLAIELLYLVEAKAAVMAEVKQLTARLQGATLEAQEQAYTDTLTGLRNRRAFDRVLTRLIEGARPFALMHLDLDYFKTVNDTLGHAAGDAVLAKVGVILQEAVRDRDMVARIGGDEFVLLFENFTDHKRLMQKARQLITRLEEPVPFEDQICQISGSVGITTSDLYARPNAKQMINDADQALYESKGAGRGRAHFYDPRAA